MYREADKEVYELYDSFVQRVLVDKKDFLDDSDDLLLTKENLEECKKRFIENYDEDKDRNFSEKAKTASKRAEISPCPSRFQKRIYRFAFYTLATPVSLAASATALATAAATPSSSGLGMM